MDVTHDDSLPTGATPTKPDRVGEIRSEVLSFVINETEAANLPKAWTFLPKQEQFRQLRTSRADLAVLLQQRFSPADLVAARVLVQVNNALELNRVFGVTSSQIFRVVNDASTGKPIDATSERGRLSTGIPAWDHLCDLKKKPHDSTSTAVLIADGDADAQVLSSLGFDSFPVLGFASLSGRRVRRLFKEPCASFRFHFTFVGWQVADLVNARSAHMEQAILKIAKIGLVYEHDSANRFSVWAPRAKEFARMESAIAFRDPQIFRQLFLASLARTESVADISREMKDAAETDLPTARHELIQAIEFANAGLGRQAVQVRLKKLQQAFERCVTHKFDASIASAATPLEALRLLMCRELAQHWFEGEAIVVSGKLAAGIKDFDYRFTLDRDYYKDRLRLIELLTRICSQLIVKD